VKPLRQEDYQALAEENRRLRQLVEAYERNASLRRQIDQIESQHRTESTLYVVKGIIATLGLILVVIASMLGLVRLVVHP
jgi:hypothetical protein